MLPCDGKYLTLLPRHLEKIVQQIKLAQPMVHVNLVDSAQTKKLDAMGFPKYQ